MKQSSPLGGALGMTLRLQPVVILYTLVSIISKFASRQVPPKEEGTLVQYCMECLCNWRLMGLVFLMFLLLACYAFIWQRVIKDAKIAVIYANKSASVFWGQLAAVLVFSEHITWANMLGIAMIFGGIILANTEGGHGND